MGNDISMESSLLESDEKNTLFNSKYTYKLDQLASSYIHEMNPNELLKLAQGDGKFCNDIIIVTAKVLSEKYNYIELKKIYNEKIDKDEDEDDYKVFYKINKPSTDKEKLLKQKLCNKISKFYIRIAHIFAAIVKTLNPKYVEGDKLIDYIGRKNPKIDKDTKLTFAGICDQRYKYLLLEQLNDTSNEDSDELLIKRDALCPSTDSYNVLQQQGFEYLRHLYETNDEYKRDAVDTMKQLYNDHAKTSPATNFDESILKEQKKNHDLELSLSKIDLEFETNERNNHNLKFNTKTRPSIAPPKSYRDQLCSKLSKKSTDIAIKKNTEIIRVYVEHIKNMLERIHVHKLKLIKILNEQLFIKDKGRFIINSKLTVNTLNKITIYVRKIIVSLYLECEKDYLESLKLLEVLLERDKLDKSKKKRESIGNIAMIRSKEDIEDELDSDVESEVYSDDEYEKEKDSLHDDNDEELYDEVVKENEYDDNDYDNETSQSVQRRDTRSINYQKELDYKIRRERHKDHYFEGNRGKYLYTRYLAHHITGYINSDDPNILLRETINQIIKLNDNEPKYRKVNSILDTIKEQNIKLHDKTNTIYDNLQDLGTQLLYNIQHTKNKIKIRYFKMEIYNQINIYILRRLDRIKV